MGELKIEDFIALLASKGFRLTEGDLQFIYFGTHYTDADDSQVKTALEITLIQQLSFDGSYFIALLESFVKENIHTKNQAFTFLEKLKNDRINQQKTTAR